MTQHFLLSSASRTFSIVKIAKMPQIPNTNLTLSETEIQAVIDWC